MMNKVVVFANAFSVGMLYPEDVDLAFRFFTSKRMRKQLAFWKHEPILYRSAIRHPATEALVQEILGINLSSMPRINAVILDPQIRLVVCLPKWKAGRPPETRDYSAEELQKLVYGVAFWIVQLLE